uniref:C2H2-type domain-containing protein n=1 Tax=Meloidogyne floridensis TaxID=298350 RepID=A0A915P7Q0_9BILA
MSSYNYFGKQQWICRLCMKTLSSKRSFDEHMNIHSKSRPFGCDECKYAAASKMTLRRHKLRNSNHVPRSNWGYQCPYCGEFYMEPASYQQHITVRHWGLSATFGCPYRNCDFTSKSSRYFREHMHRHQAVFISSNDGTPFNLNLDNLSLYLINDECGTGDSRNLFISNKRISRCHNFRKNMYGIQQKTPKVVHRFIYNNAIRERMKDEEENNVFQHLTINVEKLLDEEEIVSKNLRECGKPSHNSKAVRFRPYSPSQFEQASEIFHTENIDNIVSKHSHQPMDWIEAEVIIDNEMTPFTKLPDGQTDDFGLD